MRAFVFRAVVVLGFWAAGMDSTPAQASGRYAELQRQAAGFYSEQSYALAHEAWAEAAKLDVPAGDRRTLDFYLADSLWRSRPDMAQVAEARRQLEALAKGEDSLAAEAAESLGDSWLALENDWARGWTEYERALKFWSASTDLEAARARYLGIVWKATGPPGRDQWSGARVPLEVLANAREIAPNAEERARAHFFLGRWHAAAGDAFSRRRAGREFQATVDAGGGTSVYEAALFELAEWNLVAGVSQWNAGGELMLEPDYDRALELFRRFTREFPKGRSALHERAVVRIDQITKPALELRVDHQFLPGVSPVARATWRNVGEVRLTLTRVDLARDFQPTGRTAPDRWLDAVRVDAGVPVRQWSEVDARGGRHAPRAKDLELEPITEPGTYLLAASAGGLTSRALVVVTAGAMVVQSIGDRVVTFLCDARTGERAAEATAKVWRVRDVDDRWRWQAGEPGPVKDGLQTFTLPRGRESMTSRIFAFGRAGMQPVIAQDFSHDFAAAGGDWRIQVFTDRAAYRPTDTVRWKTVARKRVDGGLVTRAGELVKFTINDPAGTKVDEGEVKLTEFGGAWGELPLRAAFPLGEYSIAFFIGNEEIGGGTLFRLEEYRLPEFKVSVATPGDAGPASRRLGDDIEIRISADYYFGGAVADAKVAVVVREDPFMRPFPGEDGSDRSMRPRGGEGGRVVKNEVVRTGPDGGAVVWISTPGDGGQDLRYVIIARVTDSSGRQVEATGSVVVARQGYFVDLTPARRVAFPKDSVTIAFRARDGNDRPVRAAGSVTVTRQRWTEVWRDPQGREVTGPALDALKRGVFPPTGEAGWRLIKQEYVSEEVARADATTDAEGKGEYKFAPEVAGFYRVEWSGPDGEGPPVTAATSVWVSTAAGSLIGYRSGGVEIIVDPTAPPKGGKVPVLVTTDTPNRDVLFLVHADGNLFRAEVLHLAGDSRLVELESDPRFVPNVFVTAGAVRGLEFFADTREVRFPPYRNTLAVEMRAADPVSLPGTEGTIRFEVKDNAGRPVRGEFALGVTDEAVSAIQEDYAGDPVDFFFGELRVAAGEPAGSISTTPFYVKPDSDSTMSGASRRRGGAEAMAFGAAAEMSPAVSRIAGAMPASAAMKEDAAPAVVVRTNFSATAFWQPGIVTDDQGRATVKFKYPDSLTTWRAVLRGASAGAEFGFAQMATRTTKPLIARLQAPRFLVAGDQVEISAVVNNRTDAPVTARADLRVEGLAGASRTQSLRVEPNGNARAAWSFDAPQPGRARLTLTAAAGSANDGTAALLPIFANGIDKAVCVSGKAVGAEIAWRLDLPVPRRAGSETLVVTATPSLAAAALDALPFLLRYPYGCVEQTMSRFLPAAVTARTLQSLGLDRAAVANRVFGGIEPEFLAKTHPRMAGTAGIEELDAAIERGLARLTDLQQDDGSWGWWKGDGSDAFMTAYVVWGLRLAQQSGVAVRSDVLDRGSAWLRAHLVDAQDAPNLQAWLLHALASRHEAGGGIDGSERAALDNLWAKRDRLTAYGRALFALAAHGFGEKAKAETLARNLRDGVVRDASAATGVAPASGAETVVPTAHWGSDGMFREWQDGGVEATAFALQALLAIDPQSDLVEPAMNWLVKNRRGAQWSNTRDTAITVLAMNRYLAATKELGRPVSFEVLVNGAKAGEATDVTALGGVSRFEVDRELLRDGANTVTLRRTAGDAPIYLSAQAQFFTLEEPIPAAGNEIFAKREYFRYAPQRTLLNGYRFDRLPWNAGEPAVRDQRIAVVLTIEAKNDLEYVLLEDLKPAGLEAVNVRSGEFLEAEGADGKRVPIYCELRDRKVALFVRKLPQGVWTIRYDLRTETAGDFSALPVMAEAMYAPEIRANGESRRITIKEEP